MKQQTKFKQTEIGMIPEDWNVLSFDKVISHVVDNRGRSAPTSENGIPLIATNCIKERGLFPEKENIRYVSKEIYDNWFRGHPKPDDIIIVNKGTPGLVCLVPDPVDFCFAQDMVSVRSDENKIYWRFLFAFMRSKTFKREVDSLNVGTTIPHLKKTYFPMLIIPIPSQTEQKIIGDIYYDISLKIELDQKMNGTLEKICRTIFKNWFIDFEFPNEGGKPYKSSGGEMVYNEEWKRDVPKGWEVKELPEVTKIVDCLHITKPIEAENDAYLLQVFNIVDYGLIDLSKKFYVSDEDYKFWTKNIEIVEGDCIISNAGRVGAIAQIPYWLKGGIGRNITAVRPVTVTPTYLVEYLFSKFGQQEIEKQTDSATVLNTLNVRGIKKIKILIPNEKAMKKYEEISRPLRKKMEINYVNMSNLTSLRDLLLPRLMSGKIRVPVGVK